jgi:hypothetical protein
MADFNVRSDSVDVEQIMKQIRTRIKEKRGVDYTEDQIREIAAVRLEKFLDPKNLRSDLLEQFRRSRPAVPPEPPPVEAPYAFSDETLFSTHRGALQFVRKLLRPILKLFFNPNTLNQILHTQAQFNVDLLKREQRRKIEFDRSRADWNALYYEVLHNLVLETTRNGIELKNLKMRVEALTSRLDFSERRVRALEGVVQYRPEIVRPRPSGHPQGGQPGRGPQPVARPRFDGESPATEGEASEAAPPDALAAGPGGGAAPMPAQSESSGRRRRRRRRGRRGAGLLPGAGPAASAESLGDAPVGDEEFDGDESDASEELAAIAADDAPLSDDGGESAIFDEAPADEQAAASREEPPPHSVEAESTADASDGTEPATPVDPDKP